MKLKIIKNTCLSIFMLLLIFSCGDKSTGNSNSKTSAPVRQQQVANGTFLYISDSSNIQQVEIVLEASGNTKINTQRGSYFGEKKGDKLKYYDQQDNFRFEIKYKDTSFKLRDRNSELLWKVKTYDKKIKLANNEEMANPIEIKLKNEQKIVIYKNGEESKTIRIDASKNPLNISNSYFTSGFKNNYQAGILNLDELSLDEKYFLLAELNR